MEIKQMQQQNFLHRRPLIGNPTASDDSYPGEGDESEFDTNMVIILAFLLGALLLAIALNVFARCGLLHIFRSSSPAAAAAPGLKKRALRQLPVAVYGSGPDMSATEECAICLAEFLDGERIRLLPKCGHGFHVGCIDTWLVTHASCPNCRVSLLQPPPRPPPPPPSDQRVAVDISSQ